MDARAKKRRKPNAADEWSADAMLANVVDAAPPAAAPPRAQRATWTLPPLPLRTPTSTASTPVLPRHQTSRPSSLSSPSAPIEEAPAPTNFEYPGDTPSAEAPNRAQNDAQPTPPTQKGQRAGGQKKGKKEPAKANNTIRPSDRCDVFLEHAMAALGIIYDMEGPPASEGCAKCSCALSAPEEGAVRLRCRDCLACPHFCQECLLATHQTMPFHRIWRWDAALRFWETISLAHLGMTLYGGRHGKPCAQRTRAPRDMVFVHEHGVTTMGFAFCECGGSPGSPVLQIPEPHQLLEAGFFPASWKEPRSAFTMGLMRSYHLLSLQTHCSAEDYYKYIKRTTDNILPHKVPDRYRELNTAAREFSFLRACKRSGVEPRGQRSGKDPNRCRTEGLQPRSLAVLCPCCPHPHRNMREGWKLRDSRYDYVDALFYSIDGNFRQRLRNKPLDKNDVPLTEGGAYFCDNKDFKEYLGKMGKADVEVSSCHKFGAMGYSGHTGKVSGIVALACRHMMMMPGGTVDLRAAEQYTYVDFAVVSGLQAFLELLLIKKTYDINCQYMINLLKRLLKWRKLCPSLRSILSTILPRIQGYVGSWHVNAHKPECRVKQSPDFQPGVGLYEGEGMERIWSETNELSQWTSEMTAGHRQDVLNDQYSDLNVRRVSDMARSLMARLKSATDGLSDAATALANVENKLPPELLQDWLTAEEIWLKKVVDIRNHKDLDNPYCSPDEALSEEAVSALLAEEHAARSDKMGEGMVAAVQGMIDVERERLALIETVRTTDAETLKTGPRKLLADKVNKLVIKADQYQRDMVSYARPAIAAATAAICKAAEDGALTLPDSFPLRDAADDEANGLEIPDSADEESEAEELLEDAGLQALLDKLEALPLDLPSMYHSKIRQHPETAALVQIERKLREGQANDAVTELQTHLTALFSIEDLRDQGTGQSHGKRVREMSATETNIGNRAKMEYRRVRRILRVLGMSEDDKMHPPLTDEDAKPFVMTAKQHSRGDKSKPTSWVWRGAGYIVDHPNEEIKGFMLDRYRPFWFRRRAAKARREEEINIIHEEMYRMLRFCEHEHDAWMERARVAEAATRAGQAVYGRRQAHRWTRLREDAQARFPAHIQQGIGMPA